MSWCLSCTSSQCDLCSHRRQCMNDKILVGWELLHCATHLHRWKCGFAVYTLQCGNVVQDSGINTVMCHGRCVEQCAHKIAVCSVKCAVYSVQCGINIAVQCTIPVPCSVAKGEEQGMGNLFQGRREVTAKPHLYNSPRFFVSLLLECIFFKIIRERSGHCNTSIHLENSLVIWISLFLLKWCLLKLRGPYNYIWKNLSGPAASRTGSAFPFLGLRPKCSKQSVYIQRDIYAFIYLSFSNKENTTHSPGYFLLWTPLVLPCQVLRPTSYVSQGTCQSPGIHRRAMFPSSR